MSALLMELFEALVQLIRAAKANNADEERQALLRIQRAASDEIARREANG